MAGAFFETFVTDGDNWLPPDNFQEHPTGVIAHRTSPTNIGLSLLANLSACDFHYITPGEFIRRTDNTLNTMGKMDRFRGHFYNWYDTQSLDPLLPLYVSSVDSGNLVGYLFILKSGLSSLPDKKIIDPQILDGLKDTLGILNDSTGKSVSANLSQISKTLDDATASPPATESRASPSAGTS